MKWNRSFLICCRANLCGKVKHLGNLDNTLVIRYFVKDFYDKRDLALPLLHYYNKKCLALASNAFSQFECTENFSWQNYRKSTAKLHISL